jgi:hypothetical protein
MISAVDTSVLLDIVARDPEHWQTSRDAVAEACDQGRVMLCEAVYAELVPHYRDRDTLDAAMRKLGLEVRPGNRESAFLAGRKWAEYRSAGGPRTRLLADFLIGAHALTFADRLLTRDRGFYSTYFPELALLG